MGDWVAVRRGRPAAGALATESSPPHRLRLLLFGPVWNPGERDETPSSRTGVRLPFEGRWHVTWGGRSLEENYHRSSPAQRYAYDFSIVRDGSFCVREGERNDDHHCFGVDILAPAAGRVVRAVDGISDNRPGEKREDEPCGNHVLLRHGEGEYSLLAHLRRGSASVDPDLADGTGIPPRFVGARIVRDGLEHHPPEEGTPELRRGDYVENG